MERRDPLSLDLRERIVDAYENGEGSQAEIGKRFAVSRSVVGKLVRQKRRTGSVECLLPSNGQNQELLTAAQKRQLERHLTEYPQATIAERQAALGLPGTAKTIWLACRRLGWRFKKSPSVRPSRIGRM